MEEVWKEINLASLHDNSSSREGLNPDNPHFILQDFLARPFSKDPPANRVSANGDTTFLVSPPPPPPATLLSLNSGPGFDFLDNSCPLRSKPRLQMQNNPISDLSNMNCPFEALASPSGLACFDKKRFQDPDNNSGDRRHKRMIKNRESAARSRARKQVYTNELELEVAHLMEENARLKRQQEQLQTALEGLCMCGWVRRHFGLGRGDYRGPQVVEPNEITRTSCLEHILDNSTTSPLKFSVTTSSESIPNAAYTHFVNQDCALASWLLSAVSSNILPQLIGTETSAFIWSTLTRLFSALSTTKVMYLHCKLCSLRKGALSMRDYLSQIKEVHEPYTLNRVTTILLDAESRLHDPLRLPLSINTAQVTAPTPTYFVSTPCLRPNTSGPSACFILFPGQTNSQDISPLLILFPDHGHLTTIVAEVSKPTLHLNYQLSTLLSTLAPITTLSNAMNLHLMFILLQTSTAHLFKLPQIL
ncbi:hypothetical protein GOBAR_DD33217 [Gossypium barbadense]|nr:hypothetical protein GOBAR_DD33217 [Gossypium barbadense]